MASPIVPTLLTATWHNPDALLWHGLQFRNQSIHKVLDILWMIRPLSNMSRTIAPGSVLLD